MPAGKSAIYYRRGKRMVRARSLEKSTNKLVSASPRRSAVAIRKWHSGSVAIRPDYRRWQPKRGRRKAGARRKATIIEQLFRWIRVPTGKVGRKKLLRW